MKGVQTKLYFDISRKGRGKRVQALLELLRERAQAAQHGYFRLVENDYSTASFHVEKEPDVISITITEGQAAPSELHLLKPLRVELTANGNFNFPQEGLYEEGAAEVSWRQENATTGFESKGSAVLQNSWALTLTAVTAEEAEDIYRRIRTGELRPKFAWANSLPEMFALGDQSF
jgi:hypothetical protein